MTTEVKRGPCATDRCEYVGAFDDLCGYSRQDHPQGPSAAGPMFRVRHEFRPHRHTSECSARFYREFFGCDVRTVSSGIWCALNHPPHDEDRSREVKLADILGSPESDASWLAMRDVLREIERRNWQCVMDAYGAVVSYDVGRRDRADFHVRAEEIEELPRAVALAAWGAVSDD